MTDTKKITITGPRAILDAWLANLESGEYEQGREALCEIKNGGQKAYCCLGVLVAGKDPEHDSLKYGAAFPRATWLKEHGIEFKNNYGYDEGHFSEQPTVYDPVKGSYRNVTALNDTDRMPFPEIAKLLRNHIKYTD